MHKKVVVYVYTYMCVYMCIIWLCIYNIFVIQKLLESANSNRVKD